VRRKVFLTLEEPSSCKLAKVLSIFVLTTIVASTVAFVLESSPDFNLTPDACQAGSLTVENCRPSPQGSTKTVFQIIEYLCIAIFTLDYGFRITTVGALSAEELDIKTEYDFQIKRSTSLQVNFPVSLMYALQWLNLIDLAAILPFYIELIAPDYVQGTSVLRVLRLIRIFRVLKMPKLRACAEMFIDVVIDALPALSMLFFMMSIVCILMASLILFAEGTEYSVDDEVVNMSPNNKYGAYIRPTVDHYGIEISPFRSFAYAFWWFFTTATTVGFGDFYPTTVAGQLVAILTFYSGIILLALPISVVGRCFNKYYPDWVKNFPDIAVEDIPSPTLPKRLSFLSDSSSKKSSSNVEEIVKSRERSADSLDVLPDAVQEDTAERDATPEQPAIPDEPEARAESSQGAPKAAWA
jgi:hypothetical protein